MKRPAKQRINKYAAKIDGNIIGGRYDATKNLAVRQQKDYFAKAEKLETQVKSIIDGVPSILQHFYIAYAEEIVKKTTANERDIVYNKWETRGLDTQVLNNIRTLLTGWTPPVGVCRFDVGRFDVNIFG